MLETALHAGFLAPGLGRRGAVARDWAPAGGGSGSEPQEDQNETRRRILEYVSRHPGVHLRGLCRELGLAMGEAQYHVGRLEKEGRISSVRRGLYRFFYPPTILGERQKDVLGMLSLDTPRELLLHLVENPNRSQAELAKATGVSQPTVSWHLKRLMELGVVQREQTAQGATYSVAGGGASVASLIRDYHPGVWERWSGRLADIFISYSEGEGGEGP